MFDFLPIKCACAQYVLSIGNKTLVMTQKGIREGGLESTHTDLNLLLERQAKPLKQALIHLLANTK
ncbi:hypothetical protein BW898_22685 [Bacillus cereus]|nr:hypothetical protein BW898_22685 [Bacillus cereus]